MVEGGTQFLTLKEHDGGMMEREEGKEREERTECLLTSYRDLERPISYD